MDWNQLLSVKRLGKPSSGMITEESRTEFQRDYDRLIFSSPFRRMQNKTQVFPLPGSIFVHNRLTHSLEVASVGRSLGNMVASQLEKKGIHSPLISEIGALVASACLAHDLGNPPFGHSGEDAIKEFFKNGEGQRQISGFDDALKLDFISFDGNANTLRMLSNKFNGRREGGFALTYSMLASIVKYPYESVVSGKKEKFGFFQSEKSVYSEIANELGLETKSKQPLQYRRHPLVFLVEAADDICYQVMDVEDAHKLKILSYKETKSLYLDFYNQENDAQKLNIIKKTLKEVTDPNEQIALLRAGVISLLVNECVAAFFNNYNSIMSGEFDHSLIKEISPIASIAMKNLTDVSFTRIYSHSSVIEIEIAGYKILTTLLQHFTDAVLNESKYGRKLLKLFPQQFVPEIKDRYSQIQSVVDFVSGMTDLYALDLYRKITGIGLTGV